MALDLAEHGIRVVGIGPGIIETGMTTPDRETVERQIPLGHRLGAPEEIGDAAVFVISDSASYVTGEILFVDGGYKLT
jgi:NAD(P)-dependent dehydrogenase (short-subunit alcohol dehydrogenase family)